MATNKGNKEASTEATEEPTEKTFSAKDLAQECGTDAKSFRRWLRSTTDRRANKGGRWVFDEAQRAEILASWAARNTKSEPETPAEEV